MKNIIISIILLSLFGIFSFFIIKENSTKEVLNIITPTKISVDLNNNKIPEQNETICITNIESFSLDNSNKFYKTYSKSLNLNNNELISLGYLAQDFAQKTLLNKKVSLKYSKKQTSECRYADIKLNGIYYSDLLKNSGFGLKNGKITNQAKYINNLNNAHKLHLVILNHHSNKYHTLDCKFGKLAKDAVLIPFNQLPETAIPCKYCHKLHNKNRTSIKYKKEIETNKNNTLKIPTLTISQGDITLLITNYTQNLKPKNSCDTKECKEFVKLADNATKSIDIAIYGYDKIDAITEALQNAHQRGVKIRFIYDENFDSTKNFYKDNDIIKNISIAHRSDKTATSSKSNMLMHNKFVIFDDKTVYTGSMNFSKNGLSGYDQNNIIIINSKEIANLYKEEFEQMLNGKFHTDKKSSTLSNIFRLGASIIEVYFSPQAHTSDKIIYLIKNAQQYIYIPTFLITHKQIANELILANKRGVDVKIIMDANNVYTRNSKHILLRENKIPLKIENYAGKLHSKTMIIDDKYLIIGSMNFSNSGENKNDENLLVIQNEKFVKEYKKFFMYLWALIPDKYLKYYPKAESPESIGSCSDGVDNNFNGKIDKDDELCKSAF